MAAKKRGTAKGGAKGSKPSRTSATKPKSNVSDPIKGRDTKGSASQQGGRTGSYGPLD